MDDIDIVRHLNALVLPPDHVVVLRIDADTIELLTESHVKRMRFSQVHVWNREMLRGPKAAPVDLFRRVGAHIRALAERRKEEGHV